MAYTFCQVPVIYTLSQKDTYIELILNEDSRIKIHGNKIGEEISKTVFNREGAVQKIYLFIDRKYLFDNKS